MIFDIYTKIWYKNTHRPSKIQFSSPWNIIPKYVFFWNNAIKKFPFLFLYFLFIFFFTKNLQFQKKIRDSLFELKIGQDMCNWICSSLTKYFSTTRTHARVILKKHEISPFYHAFNIGIQCIFSHVVLQNTLLWKSFVKIRSNIRNLLKKLIWSHSLIVEKVLRVILFL